MPRSCIALLASAACLTACGRGAGGSPDGDMSACPMDDGTVTVSGAISGARTLGDVSGSWYSTDNVGYATAATSMPDAPFSVFGGFSFAGEPGPGTYTHSGSSLPGVECVFTVAVPGTHPTEEWALDTTDPARPLGTCTLSLTSVTTKWVVSSLKAYCLHGWLTASVPAAPDGAQGPVTIKASF